MAVNGTWGGLLAETNLFSHPKNHINRRILRMVLRPSTRKISETMVFEGSLCLGGLSTPSSYLGRAQSTCEETYRGDSVIVDGQVKADTTGGGLVGLGFQVLK